MKHKKKLMIVVFLLLLMVAIFTSQAYAYVRNGPDGKWGASSAADLKYWKDSSVDSYGYGGRVDFGASQWNEVSSKVKLTNVTSGYVHIKVFAGDIKDTALADALNYKTNFWGNYIACWDCTYELSRIRINDPVISTYVLDYQYKALTHEFGHSLGLDHGDITPAVMVPGWNNYKVPQTDDKKGIKAIYGN